MKKILLALLFSLHPLVAYTQSGVMQAPGCPPGLAPGQPGCGGKVSNNAQRSAYRGPIWQDRYGAIATDPETGSYGWVSDASSRKIAKKAAIDDCGGGGCQVQLEGRNNCLAMAWGNGVRSFASEPSLREAEVAVMEKCHRNGSGDTCTLDYSACSLPVRIQ